MNRDVICAESELSIAANKIDDYGEFLGECLHEYAAIMRRVAASGLQGSATPKITRIAMSASAMVLPVELEAAQLSNTIKKYVEEIAEADNFRFPKQDLGMLRILLSAFF